MNKLRNLLAIIALFSSLLVVTSCDDDDDPAVVERPSISSSSASTSIITGNSAALTFNVTVPSNSTQIDLRTTDPSTPFSGYFYVVNVNGGKYIRASGVYATA